MSNLFLFEIKDSFDSKRRKKTPKKMLFEHFNSMWIQKKKSLECLGLFFVRLSLDNYKNKI